MALSHREASDGFVENDPGSAVLISDRLAIVVLEVWVDMELFTGGIRVLGLTTGGMKVGSEVGFSKGVVAWSRGLLGLGSGLMSLGSQLNLDLRWEILGKRG